MYRCHAGQALYFARITNYKSCQEQEEEIRWTRFLNDQGVGVPKAIASSNLSKQ